MIKLITQMLSLSDFYNISDNVDIAKGKYEIPLTIKKAWKKRKR